MATAKHTYIVRNNDNKIIDVRTTARVYTHSNGDNYYGSYELACKAGDADAYPVQLADTAELKKEASYFKRVGQYVSKAEWRHNHMRMMLNYLVKYINEGRVNTAYDYAEKVLRDAESARELYLKARLDVPHDVVIYSAMETTGEVFAHLGFDVPAQVTVKQEWDRELRHYVYTLFSEGVELGPVSRRKIGTRIRKSGSVNERKQGPTVEVDVFEYYVIIDGIEYSSDLGPRGLAEQVAKR